jgi:hypothetical protein
MTQHEPTEKVTLDQVLNLAHQLPPEEQEQLVQEMKLIWLRRAMDEAEKSAADDQVVSEEQIAQRLDDKRREILRKQRH